jgi:hypothetical protein
MASNSPLQKEMLTPSGAAGREAGGYAPNRVRIDISQEIHDHGPFEVEMSSAGGQKSTPSNDLICKLQRLYRNSNNSWP